jgi:hypothetical protein
MNNPMTEDEFSDLFRQTAGRLHAYAVRQVGARQRCIRKAVSGRNAQLTLDRGFCCPDTA